MQDEGKRNKKKKIHQALHIHEMTMERVWGTTTGGYGKKGRTVKKSDLGFWGNKYADLSKSFTLLFVNLPRSIKVILR